MSTLLVIDAHYLCHRAFHTSGHLSHGSMFTGVAFGFLKTIGLLKDQFVTDKVIFCFEGHTLHRKRVFSAYKQSRARNKDPKEINRYISLRKQIDDLRTVHLPNAGFANVACYDGFESDDIMAAVAKEESDNQKVVLVTSDQDLFQCLGPNVFIYSPQKQKLLGEKWFREHYQINPAKWSLVKAIAGCKGDGVPGVHGVGEVTALKFVRGELDKGSKPYQLITCKEGRERVLFNRALVQLPYRGCPVPSWQPDTLTPKTWLKVCSDLGMRSLAGRPPIVGIV